MSSIIRGRRAAFLPTLLLIAAGCPADDVDDSATSVAQTSTDSTPTTSSATDPSDSSTTPVESSTTDTPAESSGEATTTPAESSGETSADESSDGGDSSTTDSGMAGLEIAGAWFDDFGGEHVITDEQWSSTFAPDVYTYTITEYDNAERFVVAQDDGNDTWSKYEWTYADDELYYCQTAFGEASPEDAIAVPDAEPADPANAGCGGFSWSRLVPQE